MAKFLIGLVAWLVSIGIAFGLGCAAGWSAAGGSGDEKPASTATHSTQHPGGGGGRG